MKRRLEHGKEEILSNKKIKYDNQQDVSTNEASSLTDDEKNFKENKSLSETDENVSESSFEGIQEKTVLSSSPSTETEEEGRTTVIDSSKSSMSNLEITKSDDAAIQNPIDIKKPSLEDIIRDYIDTLQEGVKDGATMNHIIASILEIYTEQRNYTEVLDQIEEDVEGIDEENETYESLCGLATLIAGHNGCLLNIYTREDIQDQEEWRDMIAGKVYNSICDIYL